MPNRAERRRHKHPQRTPGFTPVYRRGGEGKKIERPLIDRKPLKEERRKKRSEPNE